MKTVSVAAPQCSPARIWLTRVRQQFKPYHPKHLGVNVTEVKEGKQVLYLKIDVEFTDAYAKWGEYLLLRHGYGLLSKPLDPDNERNARKWLDGTQRKGWFEPGCHDKPKDGAIGEIKDAAPPPPWEEQRRRPTAHGKSKHGGFLDGLLRELLQ